jgi:hypothetical protein
MKRFKITQGNEEIVSHSGLSLIGQLINRYTTLEKEVNQGVPLRHGIPHSEVLKSYLGLLCTGKNDFEAINRIDSEMFFTTALGIETLPSEATLRQRMDKYAEAYLPVIIKANGDFLKRSKPALELLFSGHVPLDGDVFTLNNAKTKKEGVSRTYQGYDGYAPMAFYLGQEGYCLEMELREGSQHCQKGTPALLRSALEKARTVTDQPLLVRLDGGNDAIENMDVILDNNAQHPEKVGIDFIIKWNPRQENKHKWMAFAEAQGQWKQVREGKRECIFTVKEKRHWKGKDYTLYRVMRIIERTSHANGQIYLEPELEMEGWWASIDATALQVIALYADHGTSEQFHSEFKTDLDIERLPSGKFSTNALVMACSMMAYNFLRYVGQNTLHGKNAPKRKDAQRRRIKTVLQDMMYLAAKVVSSGRRLFLQFGRSCRASKVFDLFYQEISCA